MMRRVWRYGAIAVVFDFEGYWGRPGKEERIERRWMWNRQNRVGCRVFKLLNADDEL